MKTIEENFRDWEANAIGYGYGTGEPYTLAALKAFMEAIGDDRGPYSYEFEKLESACRRDTAWLLISLLCKADIIEYGTSPRYGWLTAEGMALCDFVRSKTVDELVEVCCHYDEGYSHCYPGTCNCGPDGYEQGKKCHNPFWAGHH